jgi:hypothetical protein
MKIEMTLTNEPMNACPNARSSKVTIVVSDVEKREIRKYLPDATLSRVSNIHEDLDSEVTPGTFAQRSGCVFVGNWNHLPNRDAALWFSREILPLVVREGKVDDSFKFHIVGANNMPPEILALNGTRMERGTGRVVTKMPSGESSKHLKKDGDSKGSVVRIMVHGYVADLRALYGTMKISVSPLRWGAGVKGKINSAMKYGVPVVCTAVSTEGK